jgi:hypothetical protein
VAQLAAAGIRADVQVGPADGLAPDVVEAVPAHRPAGRGGQQEPGMAELPPETRQSSVTSTGGICDIWAASASAVGRPSGESCSLLCLGGSSTT